MSQVSRPMQILLAATVLFAVAWFVALRPKPSDAGGGAPAPAAAPTAPGVKGLTTAIRDAHGAVATAGAAGRRSAGAAGARTDAPGAGAAGAPARGEAAGMTASARVTASHGAVATRATPAVAPRAHRHATTPARGRADRRAAAVRAALAHHRAIAIAFVDPHTADSRALAGELAHVSRFGGRALTLSVSIGELSRFSAITREVQVTTAPTTVIVARDGGATTIVGFADRFEIQQRLADAVAQRR
jgi:hypothetical protein